MLKYWAYLFAVHHIIASYEARNMLAEAYLDHGL